MRVAHCCVTSSVSGGGRSFFEACGEVREWLNRSVSKTDVRVTVPWVRIPPSPPLLRQTQNAAVPAFCVYDWRGGRVAEGAALEMLYTGNCIEGSNPSSSASSQDGFNFLRLGRMGRSLPVGRNQRLVGRGKSEHHRAASRLTAGRVRGDGNIARARRQVQQRTDSLTYAPFRRRSGDGETVR